MHVAHLPVSVQTLVYLELKPFPDQLHKVLWLSGPKENGRQEHTLLAGQFCQKDTKKTHLNMTRITSLRAP